MMAKRVGRRAKLERGTILCGLKAPDSRNTLDEMSRTVPHTPGHLVPHTVRYVLAEPLPAPSEHAEAVLKWIWVGGLLLVAASLLTAGEGALYRRGGTRVAGWQFAQLAHGAVFYIPQVRGEVGRRVFPMTALQAWGLALGAMMSLWLTFGGGVTAYVGVHTSRPARWVGLGAGMCFVAGVLGTLSTVAFFHARGIGFREGAFLWMAAPWLISVGLWRCARRMPTSLG
jgi:hypothetical protein